MKRTTKYVGLDVHQATVAASVRDETGRVIARSVLPTEEGAIVEYVRGMRGTIFVAFEEGTQSQWLHDVLDPIVDDVLVCDTHGERRRGNKNDVTDADQLSERLRVGGLRRVYHGSPQRLELKELVRAYTNLVEDSTRVMLRIKAIFRARGIKTPGSSVYRADDRASWVDQLQQKGARLRLAGLYAELDVISALRPTAKGAMIAEARRNPGWKILGSIPFFGPIRVALLLAIMASPHRFRTKRSIWAYAGLAVVTVSSADHAMVEGRAVRRRRAPMTRGLNRNHNRVLKDVFKGAANAAAAAPGPLQDFYQGMIERGMREEMAKLTLARKIAAITLRLWKRGELYDPAKLTTQAS